MRPAMGERADEPQSKTREAICRSMIGSEGDAAVSAEVKPVPPRTARFFDQGTAFTGSAPLPRSVGIGALIPAVEALLPDGIYMWLNQPAGGGRGAYSGGSLRRQRGGSLRSTRRAPQPSPPPPRTPRARFSPPSLTSRGDVYQGPARREPRKRCAALRLKRYFTHAASLRR